jgi:uncharacterized membrane protein
VYYALIAAFALLVIVGRRTAISQRLRSWLVFVPRLAVLAILLLILLNPVVRSEHRLPAEPPQVHFLVDASRSMALDQPASRSLQAQQVIQSVDQQLPSGDDRPQVLLYRFGQSLGSAADLSQLAPQDDQSLLAAALEQLPSRFSREPPRAVVVFSDGAVQDADRLGELAAAFEQMQVPLHVYPLGGNDVRGDVAIEELVVPPRVDVGQKATIHCAVRGTGYAGERVVLQVKSADRPELPPLATLPVTLAESPQPFDLVVEANADYGELILEAPPLAGEVTTQNNRVPFQLAKAPRKIKVLYMEGTGNNEYRWVRDALVEDKDIECVAMVADQQYVERPRLIRVDDNLRGYPATREELLQYDCVICSDISMGAFTREQLEWTVELVNERGGGFAMVGGHTSFGSGNWDQTVWDQLIPIDMKGGALGRGWVYQDFFVRVPEEAQSHPIWRIVEDPAENRRVLAAMPRFRGTNYMQRLKPAAMVLGVSATEILQIGVMPIFAAQPYGRGRTFAFAPDTTADWGMFFESQWGEGDNRYFRRFWRNIVRWLTENSVAGNKRLVVETDRVIYRTGQPIALTAHAYDEQLRETTAYQVTARLKPESAGADSSASPAATLAVAIGTAYSGELPAREPVATTGLQAAAVAPTREIEVVATHDGKEIGRTTAKVIIVPDAREFLDPKPRPEVLTALADAAGGSVLRSAADVAALLADMPTSEGDAVVARQPLWDAPWIWGAILALLAVEWSLRRRAGYG